MTTPMQTTVHPKVETDEEMHRANVVHLAKSTREREGDIEIDDDAVVSDGDDNGAYVQAWVWIPFSGTDLDKEGASNE